MPKTHPPFFSIPHPLDKENTFPYNIGMKEITQSFEIKDRIKYPEIFARYHHNGDVYITIETNGLSSERNRIISFSAGWIEGDKIMTLIYASTNDDDELSIIEKAIETIKRADRIVTYGGDTFDLAFISGRAEVYAKRLAIGESYDIKKSISPLKRLLPSGSLSLYSLLEEMGLADPSVPDGKTLVTLYKTFIKTGSDRYIDPVNKHSIFKLTGIMNLLTLIDCLGINCASVSIEEMASDENSLRVKGKTDILSPIRLCFRLPGIELSFIGKEFYAVFELCDEKLRMYFPDPASYVRLRSDGSLIPKELASSLDKSSYEKVTKESCFSLADIPKDKKQLESYIRSLEKM